MATVPPSEPNRVDPLTAPNIRPPMPEPSSPEPPETEPLPPDIDEPDRCPEETRAPNEDGYSTGSLAAARSWMTSSSAVWLKSA